MATQSNIIYIEARLKNPAVRNIVLWPGISRQLCYALAEVLIPSAETINKAGVQSIVSRD